MNHYKHLMLAILLFGFSLPALADGHASKAEMQILATTSSWVNQSGSVASISFTPSSQPGTHSVSGIYVNNAPGYRCQGTPYPISGIYYANTQTVSFSVAWFNSSEDCQSVTGWTGYFNVATSPVVMTTNWNISYLTGNGHAISQGSDVFTMQSTVKSSQLQSQ
ncbi:MAG: avidin/streptavidin family protein [Rhizobiaceae bacterium]